MSRLLLVLTLTLALGSAHANPIPTLTDVFLSNMHLDGIERTPCTQAGPNTARREVEERAACFWFNPELAFGTPKAPWDLIPIIEHYADTTFQERLPWSRDDQVEVEGGALRGLAQGTETSLYWGDDGMAVWIYFGTTIDSNDRHVLVFNYFRAVEPDPEDD